MKIFTFLKLLKSYINGDFAYKNYLQHHAKEHPNSTPLSKKDFFAAQQKHKWTKINRCC